MFEQAARKTSIFAIDTVRNVSLALPLASSSGSLWGALLSRLLIWFTGSGSSSICFAWFLPSWTAHALCSLLTSFSIYRCPTNFRTGVFSRDLGGRSASVIMAPQHVGQIFSTPVSIAWFEKSATLLQEEHVNAPIIGGSCTESDFNFDLWCICSSTIIGD